MFPFQNRGPSHRTSSAVLYLIPFCTFFISHVIFLLGILRHILFNIHVFGVFINVSNLILLTEKIFYIVLITLNFFKAFSNDKEVV